MSDVLQLKNEFYNYIELNFDSLAQFANVVKKYYLTIPITQGAFKDAKLIESSDYLFLFDIDNKEDDIKTGLEIEDVKEKEKEKEKKGKNVIQDIEKSKTYYIFTIIAALIIYKLVKE